jgi:Tfp pilus assembly protein PilF
LERAAEIAPGAFKVHYELGKAYFDSRRFDPARQQAEETVKLDPSDSSGHYLLGRIYQRLNRKELATEQFRMTAELIHNKNLNSPTGMASGTKSH